MQRQQTTLTLSVPTETKERLSALAERFDLRWGDKPSPSKLVAAIADGSLRIGEPSRFGLEEIKALIHAIKALYAGGDASSAKVLTSLALSYQEQFGSLETEQIYKAMADGAFAWRDTIEQAINARQPFVILYRGNKDVSSHYVVKYAEIRQIFGNWYVDIRSDDAVSSSKDLPELRENRSLRLDKIDKIVSTILPIPWAEDGLQSIIVSMKFFDEDAAFYERHPDDIDVSECVDDAVKYRMVRRKVTNSWWFIRDILRHGDNAVILSPNELTKKAEDRFQRAVGRYRDRNSAD